MSVPLWLVTIIASTSLGIGFAGRLLCKTITDGIGKWVADWLTDRRREKNERNRKEQALTDLKSSVGEVWSQLKQHLTEHPEIRDVLLVPKKICYNWPPHIRYDDDGPEHHALLNKFRELESKGCVTDVSTNLAAYRITEQFAKMLTSE